MIRLGHWLRVLGDQIWSRQPHRSVTLYNDTDLNTLVSAEPLTRDALLALIASVDDLSQLDLSNANMRNINLSNLNLDGIKFGDYERGVGADLTGAYLYSTSICHATLCYVTLTGAKLRQADLTCTDLRGALCDRADFREVDLKYVDFYRADLSDANLSRARLNGVNWYLVKLNQTLFQRVNLGKKLLWEDNSQYDVYAARLQARGSPLDTSLPWRLVRAAEIYDAFYANWQSMAQLSDAGWAYTRARRLRKRLHLPPYARWAYGESELGDVHVTGQHHEGRAVSLPNTHPKVLWFYARHLSQWLMDWAVEILCDYGESLWRVIFWMAAVLFLIGPALIGLAGGLLWPQEALETLLALPVNWQRSVYAYFQYFLYMINVFTTADFAQLEPANDLVRLVSGLMAIVGIFLAGLLGFVAGNRIRQA